MTKRGLIEKKLKAIHDKIDVLNAEKRLLIEEGYMLSDKQQQYTETMETYGRGKKKRTVLTGRIHWKEDFKCENPSGIITIERSCVVRQDGEWIR